MESISLINQPPHFYIALFVIITFIATNFSKSEKVKKIAHSLLRIGFLGMLVTGIYVVSSIPLTIWVLIKAIGGIGLIIMAEILASKKGGKYTLILWASLLVTATCGLIIAYFFIK